MRIKRLELQGFKSFKDKTAINFDTGITGIVGPNGCGKSNVVDAFFWALGEMNPRNLRGLNMEDLIFNGSSHAPPSNVAEVNLILEVPAELSGPNAPAGASLADFSFAPLTREVAITRRLYRNGESEYLINKVQCRLKDIQELFMDTGAGARGYSIIQQGKIAEIVNAKPDERRTMIEDVAGIVKYKSRRREAQRKLEGTNQNLLRVNDILTEIEGRRRQMERQAEKARRYKEWREQLQTIELRYASAQWEDIAEKLGASDRELADLEARDLGLSAERQSADLNYAQKKLEATSAEKITEELQAKWIRQGQELSAAENDRNYQQKILSDLTASITNLEREAEEERARAEELRIILLEIEQNNEIVNGDYDAACAKRMSLDTEAAEARQQADTQEQTAAESHRGYLLASAEVARVNQRLQSTEARRADLELRLAELEANRAELEARFEAMSSDRTAAEEKQAILGEELDRADAGVHQLREELQTTRALLEQNRRVAAEVERREVQTATSLQALEEQKRRFAGSGLGVQSVFQSILPKQSAWQDQVVGTLAAALKSAPGMEIVLEAALGSAFEIILTKKGDIVDELAAALRNMAAGRAVFADLSRLGGLEEKIGTPEGAARVLDHVEVIANEARAEIALLLERLLGKFFVVDSLNQARALAAAHPELTIVTKAGEVCRGSWYVHGGDTAQVSGAILARNREIETLQAALLSLEQEVTEARAAVLNAETALSKLQDDLRIAETNREAKRSLLTEAKSELSILDAETRQAERALQLASQETSRVSSEIAQLQELADSARRELVGLEAQSAELHAAWEANQASLPELREMANRVQEALMEAKVREAGLREQKNSLQAQKSNAQSNLDRASARQTSLQTQHGEKSEAQAICNEKLIELGMTIESLRQSIVEAEANYRTARDSLDQINAELDQHRESAEATIRQERVIKDSIAQVKLNVERAQFERQNISQNVLDRYGIEMGEFVSNPEVREQLELLRNAGTEAQKNLESEVLRLKEKIRKLGEVNISAIEEFDELSTRFQFLSEQKADLEKSMHDLQNTIDKINRISKERFFRAFNEVNTQFKKVFPALFGGGMAELTLTAMDDFNETGVDIVAQPPGKKLQNINLLSGGEKTLTAISLLFAIFLVKPSPFCLLDEVDAPLDDANIGRYNALLREMSKHSQFIIITHNKRTMELNDKLYGVTMEDAGISKMVSIQLAG